MPRSRSKTISPMAGSAGALDVALLDVTGMICGGCAARIRDRLLAWPGVSSVEIDLTRETARVVFVRNRVLYRDLADVISGAGGNEHNPFEATVLA